MSNKKIRIIIEICKAPTLRLKALNKHTHIMYIGNTPPPKKKTKKNKKKNRVYIARCSSIIMDEHTH